MTTYNASDMTSNEAVKALHAGLNSRVFTYGLDGTASGAILINMGRLPGGARVQDLNVISSVDDIGTGAETMAVYDSLGNTYIKTTTFAIRLEANNYAGINTRLTSSAHLILQLCNMVGTGTASMQFSLHVDYLHEDTPD